jgi:hypothetical protein
VSGQESREQLFSPQRAGKKLTKNFSCGEDRKLVKILGAAGK